MTHLFLLTPHIWLGQGKIQMNMVEEELEFFTRWNVLEQDPYGEVECLQEIQVKGLSEMLFNQFFFSDLAQGNFQVHLENSALGKIQGKGFINEKVIAWEFAVKELGFQGFEFYEKQREDAYLMQAEYTTSDKLRTHITGRIWQSSHSTKGKL